MNSYERQNQQPESVNLSRDHKYHAQREFYEQYLRTYTNFIICISYYFQLSPELQLKHLLAMTKGLFELVSIHHRFIKHIVKNEH